MEAVCYQSLLLEYRLAIFTGKSVQFGSKAAWSGTRRPARSELRREASENEEIAGFLDRGFTYTPDSSGFSPRNAGNKPWIESVSISHCSKWFGFPLRVGGSKVWLTFATLMYLIHLL